MKSVYSDLKNITGGHSAGIVDVMITPREWLATEPVVDFETGKILQALSLKTNKFFLLLQLAPYSYNYEAKPKASKSGDYYEVNASGDLNTFNYSLRQVVETLRYSECVAIVRDRNKRRILIGNGEDAMKISIFHSIKNGNSAEEKTTIDFSFECDEAPPFYNPDNTPDILGNYLIDSDGNYLLVG